MRTLSALILLSCFLCSCDFHKAELKHNASLLHNNKVLDDSTYRALMSDIATEHVKQEFDFVNYFEHTTVIKLPAKPDDALAQLDKIHAKTAALLPDLAYTGFSYTIDESDTALKNKGGYSVTVQLNANGKTYKQKSTIKNIEPYNEEYYGGLGNTYYLLFNKILADRQSPYRLHKISWDGVIIDDNYQFGIIVLTKHKYELMTKSGAGLSVSYENYDNSLTTNRIDSAIAAYQRLGLLANLSPQQIQQGRDKIAEKTFTNINDVLASFTGVLYDIDMEDGDTLTHRQVLVELTKISGGDFKPTAATDSFFTAEKDSEILKFKLNGKSYRRKLYSNSGYSKNRVVRWADTLAMENKLKGRFYDISPDDEDATIIYLTLQQKQYLEENKFLIFNNPKTDTR